jgi:Fuc2NAc and GlcNAc transferase
LVLGGVFLADATVTLFVRARSRAAVTEAHRSHAYQRLSRQWGSHSPVTLACAGINVFWLGPWALVATYWPQYGAVCALVAVGPLFVIAAHLGAGREGEIAAGSGRGSAG